MMKKINIILVLLIIFLKFSAKAQYQNSQYIGGKKTLVHSYGGLVSDSGYVIPSLDTATVSQIGYYNSTSDRGAGMLLQNGYVYYATSAGWKGFIGADSIASYTTMRSYTGSARVLINTDSRTGGEFIQVFSGSENGATLIVSADGRKWKRLEANGDYWKPEWYEIGGKDINGASYNRLTGTGIGSEADAIINICLLAGYGGNIVYQNEQFKTYEFDRYVPQIQNQSHGAQAGKAKWKRAAPVTTLLVNNEAIGSTSIEVVDASNFQAGMGFVVKKAGTEGGYGQTSLGVGGNDFHLITSISGNTLTIQSGAKAINAAVSAGDTVVSVASFIIRENGIEGASDTNHFVTLQNLIIDGNQRQNYQFKDYQVNCGIQNFGYLVCENVTFQNNPTENMYLAGGYINNCVGDSLGGSFIHFSNNQNTLPAEYLQVTVSNCIIDSVNLVGAQLMGHSEAVFTGSTRSSYSIYKNNRVTNGGEFIWASNSGDDGVYDIDDNYFANCLGIMSHRGIDSNTQDGHRLKITNNDFYNCGVVEILGQDIRNSNGLNGLYIDNNRFINTRFYFAELANFTFSNNQVIFDSLTCVFYDSIPHGGGLPAQPWAGNSQNAAFCVVPSSDAVWVTNNLFQGFNNTKIASGVMLQLDTAIRTTIGGTTTDYLYGEDYKINENTIADFRYATNIYISRFGYATVGWEMSRNTIYMCRYSEFASDYCYGLQVPPGAVADNNKIYNYFNSNYSFPIMAFGIQDLGNNNIQKLLGATVNSNYIFGKASYPIYLAFGDFSPYNMVVTNNQYMAGSIYGSATALANTFRAGNNLLSSDNLPALTNYQTPIYHRASGSY